MSHHTDLISIDPSTLQEVGGGTVSSGGSSGSSDQLATALQSIQTAIANLAKNNSGGDSFSKMLPFLLMMRGGGGGGCGCGCGRPGCCR